MATRFRLGPVSVRFKLFDKEMPAGFPARMHQSARRFTEILGQHFDVVYPGLIADEEDGRRVGQPLASERLDSVVFAPAMAAPPSFATVVPAPGRIGD